MRGQPVLVTFAAAAAACIAPLFAPTPALAQGEVICCNQILAVGGDWDTSNRDCIGYMNQSTITRANVCRRLACPVYGSAAEQADGLLPATARAQGPTSSLTCCDDVAALCGVNSCKNNPPAKGFIYLEGYRDTRVRTEPSNDAPSIDIGLRDGYRFYYREFVRVEGRTWFHIVGPNGGGAGWVHAGDTSCVRPSFRSQDEEVGDWMLHFSRWLQKRAEDVVGTDIIGTVPAGGKA
jgi:hypothetical protein